PYDHTAFALATADASGRPSVRMLLLKGADENGFAFYTNLNSRKAAVLRGNPHGAICFHWKNLRRQIRVSGPVTSVSDAEADAYFASRDHASRLGAWASLQSSPMVSRAELQQRHAELQTQYPEGSEVPRPPHWSGWRLEPGEVEFWLHGDNRLHERLLYKKTGDGWERSILYP
ncbi:MAG: pyridoxamine 5'-phosphate oxidase, partial [Verrucomicrobiota bacterium]|nr:pyridoxamine 5'-phosphate oxidase [Verrucomicrobiota bacterium]